jgi:hypothetical protein
MPVLLIGKTVLFVSVVVMKPLLRDVHLVS